MIGMGLKEKLGKFYQKSGGMVVVGIVVVMVQRILYRWIDGVITTLN